MSEQERRDDETEVEGHGARPGENAEPLEDDEDEFEAHIQRFSNVRMD